MATENLLQLTGAVELQAAADGEPTKRPTFRIVAYTGAVMTPAGFYSPAIVDLAGLKADRQRIPILLDHDSTRIVGQTDTVTIDSSGVRLAGTITGDDADAAKVITHARNGFIWQASIGASIVRREFLEAGKSAVVNGRKVTGPLLIARESQLKETSFVAIGADGNTSAAIAAKAKSTMPTELNTDDTSTTVDPIQAERERVAEIMQAAAEYPAIQAEAIRDGWTVDQTTAATLAALRASRATVGLIRGEPGGPTLATPECSLLLRAGRDELAVKAYGERTAEGARRMRFSSLVDVCAATIRLEGRDPAGLSRSELIQASFSTLSLPTAFSNVMGKALMDAYLEATASWRGFAAVKPAADFKPQTGIRPSFVGDLEELARDGEIKHGTLAESTFPWSIATYAKMFSVDRQHVINDDLGFIEETPRLMATAAARRLNDLIWELIMANGGAFFSTGHSNLKSGVTVGTNDSRLNIEGLTRAVSAMRSQRDDQGNDLQVAPAVLAVPPDLEFAARQLINSALLGKVDGEPSGNPFANLVEVVAEPGCATRSSPATQHRRGICSRVRWPHRSSSGSSTAARRQ